MGLVNKENETFRIEGWCHLGEKMEVYDAEIHAVVELTDTSGFITRE
jgi:hypothetical protein